MKSATRGATRRQVEVLAAIDAEIRQRGFPPTVRDLGKALGLSSSSTIGHHIKALWLKGYVDKNPRQPRTLVVTEKGRALLEPLAATYGRGNAEGGNGE
jgi:repressor LexA